MPRWVCWVAPIAVALPLLILGLRAAEDPGAASTAPAVPPPPARSGEPIELIPAEHLLCWYGSPFPGTTPVGDERTFMELMAGYLPRVFGKQLDQSGQLTARGVEVLSLFVRYPFAIALLDALAKPMESDPNAPQLDRLKVVLVVNTGGKSEPFLRVIQKMVNEQTGTQYATLETKQIGRLKYQELGDTRFPGWCHIAWGQIDEFFVLTLGEEVWPQVAEVAAGRQPGAARDPWVRSVRNKRGTSQIEIILAARRTRERLDPFVHDQATAFFAAWQATEVERAHWSLGFDPGGGVFCLAHFQDAAGKTRERLYADPSFRTADLDAVIPGDARYAVYHLPLTTFAPQLVRSIMATRGLNTQERAAAIWQRIQREAGIDAEKDILERLGNRVILHNFPVHPLRLPLACTMLIEIKSEPRRVREALEKVGEGWQAYLDDYESRAEKPNLTRLIRDPDGVWYWQHGFFVGAAIAITDRYIITSWSPLALREYLSVAGEAVGKR